LTYSGGKHHKQDGFKPHLPLKILKQDGVNPQLTLNLLPNEEPHLPLKILIPGWGQPTTTTEPASKWGDKNTKTTQSTGRRKPHTSPPENPNKNKDPEVQPSQKEEKPIKLANDDSHLIYVYVDVHHKEKY